MDNSPGLGVGPLKFSEIAAACPWTTSAERRVLRRMSETFLEGVEIGKDVLGKAPWEETE